jgi:23S rRNA (uracil1939-C5)-methyltransferase
MSAAGPGRDFARVAIEAIGAGGDGIARLGGKPVYVPFTLPGDVVRVRLRGRRGEGLAASLLEVVEPGPARVEPPCPHFGACGGCGLQHLADGAYLGWKRETVVQALAHRGIEADVAPILRIPPGRRRRATFVASREGRRVRLGFHGPASHAVIDLRTCLILLPPLVALMEPLRAALAPLLSPRQTAAVAVTWTDGGADVLVASRAPPDLAAREALAAFAETADVARLSWSRPRGVPEPLALRRAPRILFGRAAVEPPPGGFLQPSAEGEAALVERARAALAGRRRLADLFSGCGTFTFPLAEAARVHAVDGHVAALAALERAARRAGLADRISTERRDLSRNPVEAAALAPFDAVIFDPPRAGARAQAVELARSKVPLVVGVSCEPATFARDARILLDAGFRLGAVTPVDQFAWSPHVELIAAFSR